MDGMEYMHCICGGLAHALHLCICNGWFGNTCIAFAVA